MFQNAWFDKSEYIPFGEIAQPIPSTFVTTDEMLRVHASSAVYHQTPAGRLGAYKYYDMDQVIESALELSNNLLGDII